MKKLIISLILNTLAVLVSAYIVKSVTVDSWVTSFIVGIVLGVLNTFVRPILVILTLPISILTLGIFVLVINTFIILVAGWIVPGFEVSSFWGAFFFSVVLSLVNMFLDMLQKD